MSHIVAGPSPLNEDLTIYTLTRQNTVHDEVIQECENGFSPSNLAESRIASSEIDGQLDAITAEINQVRATYKKLASLKLSLQMDKSRIHNGFAPLLKLPPELIGYIMELLCLSPSSERRFKKDRPELTCASICENLRDIAIATPSLWTHISFSSSHTAELHIQRSRSLPLHILLTLSSSKSRQELSMTHWNAVMLHSTRIHRLLLHLDTTYANVIGQMLTPLDFPTLESLALVFMSVGNGVVRDSSYFLPKAPKLSQLWLSSLQGTHLPIPPSTKALVLSPLTLQPQALAIYAPNLTHLVLCGFSPYLTLDSDDIIDFPCLTTLRMNHSDGLQHFARCIQAINLQTLILQSWWSSPFKEWLQGPTGPNIPPPSITKCYFPFLRTLILLASDIHGFTAADVKAVNTHFSSVRHFAAFNGVGSSFLEHLKHGWFFPNLSRLTLLPLPAQYRTSSGASSTFPFPIFPKVEEMLKMRMEDGKMIANVTVHDKLRGKGKEVIQPYVKKVDYVTEWEGLLNLEGWVDAASYSYEIIFGPDYK